MWQVLSSGLIVPVLLILGNKHFGISANLRHACAACFPANIKFFKYEWKRKFGISSLWAGILTGAVIAVTPLGNPVPVHVNPNLAAELSRYGINDYSNVVPKQLFSFESLFTLRGLILLGGGGFLVGFGSRSFSTSSEKSRCS